jgi:hypothetical protein
VEVDAPEAKLAVRAAMAAFAASAECNFRTGLASFRMEVRRKSSDGTYHWELRNYGA